MKITYDRILDKFIIDGMSMKHSAAMQYINKKADKLLGDRKACTMWEIEPEKYGVGVNGPRCVILGEKKYAQLMCDAINNSEHVIEEEL